VPVSHALPQLTATAGREDGQLPGAADVAELAGLSGRVSDPRKPRGVRHRIAAVLTVTVFAVLAGARNYRLIGDAVADLPEELLALAAVRRHRRTGWCQPPSEPTIRRVVEGIDTAQDHQHACTGATAQAMAMLRNLAIGLIRLVGLTQITRTPERIAADRMRILPLLAASRP